MAVAFRSGRPDLVNRHDLRFRADGDRHLSGEISWLRRRQNTAGAVVVGRVESEGGQEVTTLPPTALLQSGDEPQVWVIGGDGKVQRRNVQVFQFDTDSVVVSHGLSAGEKVVTAGVNSLADGELVNAETEVE